MSYSIDTRPRAKYLLPDGSVIRVILDHGETPSFAIGYQLLGGKIVTATYAGMAEVVS